MDIREYREYKAEDVLRLYASVGWTAYTDDPAALERGFRHSLLVLAAWEDGELAGLIRAVGDGATIVFIQDILVAPEPGSAAGSAQPCCAPCSSDSTACGRSS